MVKYKLSFNMSDRIKYEIVLMHNPSFLETQKEVAVGIERE
jgi:2-oxoglutarate dehydrogenase complex dehydrogenase (E1) component-like enzyme